MTANQKKATSVARDEIRKYLARIGKLGGKKGGKVKSKAKAAAARRNARRPRPRKDTK